MICCLETPLRDIRAKIHPKPQESSSGEAQCLVEQPSAPDSAPPSLLLPWKPSTAGNNLFEHLGEERGHDIAGAPLPLLSGASPDGALFPLTLPTAHSTFPTEGDSWGRKCNEGPFPFSILLIYCPSPSAGSGGGSADQYEMQPAELRLCSRSAPHESRMGI